MKAPKNINELSAYEIMSIFCPQGSAVEGVDVDQNWTTETTTIIFDDCTVKVQSTTVEIIKE